MKTSTITLRKHNRGFVDFGAGLLLIAGFVAVTALLGAATIIHDGIPASAPDGWSMMVK